MQIAIQYEKYNLGEDRFIFKPISVIRGIYSEDEECFITDSGMCCYLISGYEPDADYYFGDLTTMGELKKVFDENMSDEDIMYNYLSIVMDNCYIGIYGLSDTEPKIDIIKIPYYSLESAMIKLEASNNFDESYDDTSIKDVPNTQVSEVSKLKLDKEKSKKITLKELRKEVLSKIIGQDRAVDDITRAIIVNYNSKNPKHKSHIMIAGPTGTGKTEIINIISKYLGVPYFKADATAYTKEGYVGKSVYSMLLGLIDAAGGDIE